MIRRIRRKRDVAPAVMMAIKVVGPMLASAVTGAVASAIGSSFKEKITDPAFEATRKKALSELKTAAQENNNNDAYSKRAIHNARESIEKLKKMAAKEKHPIVNLLHAAAQGLKTEEMAMLRGDSMPRRHRHRVKRSDCMTMDSRARRTTRRPSPNHATAWEIKKVIGWTQPDPLPKDYKGSVDADGTVHVTRGGRHVGSLSGVELDRLEMMERGGSRFSTWIGPATNENQQARIEQTNQQNLRNGRSSFTKAGEYLRTALKSVDMVSQGIASTMSTAERNSAMLMELLRLWRTLNQRWNFTHAPAANTNVEINTRAYARAA